MATALALVHHIVQGVPVTDIDTGRLISLDGFQLHAERLLAVLYGCDSLPQCTLDESRQREPAAGGQITSLAQKLIIQIEGNFHHAAALQEERNHITEQEAPETVPRGQP